MISFDIIVVIVVLAFILVSLYMELFGPGFTFLIGITILGVFQILSPGEMLAGFANEQIAIIIMLILLGSVFQQTSLLDIVFDKIFKKANNYNSFLGRMMIMISGMSAFLNNTPLVALMMPYVHNWSKKNKVPLSKLLIPLSYAAILGGCATLIGTSTNLIVNGLVIEQDIIPNLEALSIFDFSYVGVPMIIIGIIYLRFLGPKMLPDRKSAADEMELSNRDYFLEVRIKKGSKWAGKMIKNTEITDQQGLKVCKLIREQYSILNIHPNLILEENDILIVSGESKLIADFVESSKELTIPNIGMFAKKEVTQLVEIVISHNSGLIGKSITSENFRRKFDATVIGIHRNGEQIQSKLDDINLKAGDNLLLITETDFSKRSRLTTDFYAISTIKEYRKIGHFKSIYLIGGALLVIILSALGISSLFKGLAILLGGSLILGIASPKELPKHIDYDLIFIIVMSLALGTAMIKTGVAEIIANFIISIFIPLGNIGLLAGIYLITTLLAAYVTNKAAAAIVFPISLTTAVHLSLNPVPFILVVAFASAANFLTPIGYQTNLMIYGPGGYNFKDFFKIGGPLSLIYMIVTVLILNFVYL